MPTCPVAPHTRRHLHVAMHYSPANAVPTDSCPFEPVVCSIWDSQALSVIKQHLADLRISLLGIVCEEITIMTISRGIATAAVLAGLAVGTASPAWADQTMSGHYIKIDKAPRGGSQTQDWYFTPCGDGCASVAVAPGAQPLSQARLVNGQWTMDITADGVCQDGTEVPGAISAHLSWDPNTLAGTTQNTYTAPMCGTPAGHQTTNTLQFRQAP
jgi:hypothetical protein